MVTLDENEYKRRYIRKIIYFLREFKFNIHIATFIYIDN